MDRAVRRRGWSRRPSLSAVRAHGHWYAPEAELRWAGTALALLYPLVVAGALAAWLLHGSLLGLLGLVGLLTLVVFVRWPIVPAALLLVLWLTFLDPKWHQIGLGPIHAPVAELVLLAALAAVVLRRLTRPSDAAPHYLFTWPVLAFLAAVVFGTGVGIVRGESVREALDALRTMFSFASFFVFRDAFRGRSERFGTWLLATTIGGCLMVVAGVAFGLPTTGLTVDHVITGGTLTDITRLNPPVLRLVSLVMVMVACGTTLRGRPVLRAAALGLMAWVEVLSFTRSTWVPLLLALLVVPILVSDRPRSLVLGERALVASIVGAVVLTLAAHGTFGLSGTTAYERIASTVNSRTLQENSLADRTQNELPAALAQIAAHPVTGIGLNRPYGAKNQGWDPVLETVTAEDRRFIHDTPLGIWLWLGLPGVLAMLWLALTTARTGLRLSRRRRRSEVAAPIAAVAGLAVLGVQSTFQTNLLFQPALVAFAVGFAFLDTWWDEHRADPHAAAVQRDAAARQRSTSRASTTARSKR